MQFLKIFPQTLHMFGNSLHGGKVSVCTQVGMRQNENKVRYIALLLYRGLFCCLLVHFAIYLLHVVAVEGTERPLRELPMSLWRPKLKKE